MMRRVPGCSCITARSTANVCGPVRPARIRLLCSRRLRVSIGVHPQSRALREVWPFTPRGYANWVSGMDKRRKRQQHIE